MKEKKKTSIGTWIVLVVIVLSAIGLIRDSIEENFKPAKPRVKHYFPSAAEVRDVAEGTAWRIVRGNLKSPNSAKLISSRMLNRAGNRRLVRVECDAQNSYGAVIRTVYCVVFRVNGGQYVWRQNWIIKGDAQVDRDALKKMVDWP